MNLSDNQKLDLRHLVANLVQTWKALSLAKNLAQTGFGAVVCDALANRIKIVLYELQVHKNWKINFPNTGCSKYMKMYSKLKEVNDFYSDDNNLHYRNCSGAHQQSFEVTNYSFQDYGFVGKRDWCALTKGVAVCLSMMKIIDGDSKINFWREIKNEVIKPIKKRPLFCSVVIDMYKMTP